jgi:hypothetical protein
MFGKSGNRVRAHAQNVANLELPSSPVEKVGAFGIEHVASPHAIGILGSGARDRLVPSASERDPVVHGVTEAV